MRPRCFLCLFVGCDSSSVAVVDAMVDAMVLAMVEEPAPSLRKVQLLP